MFNWLGYGMCDDEIESPELEKEIQDKCYELETNAKASAQAAFDKWLAEKGLEIVMGVVRPIQNQILPGSYTSVWDDTVCVTTPCMVDMTAGKVFDIEMSGVEINGQCTKEYVTVNGHKYDIVPKEEYDEAWAALSVLWRE